MSAVQTIKQLEERNVANEINFMVWSDRMDLVAAANSKGKSYASILFILSVVLFIRGSCFT